MACPKAQRCVLTKETVSKEEHNVVLLPPYQHLSNFKGQIGYLEILLKCRFDSVGLEPGQESLNF